MGVAILSGGVAFGAARSKVTDIQQDARDLKDELVAHKREDVKVHQELMTSAARTEAKLDLILEELRRR